MKTLSLSLAVLLAVATADSRAAAAVATVSIDKFMFSPMEITVTPGSTVAWVNHDQTPHTVAARDRAFASGAMDTGDRYERTFTAEGDFSYVCSLHPFMTGVVHVRANRSAKAPALHGR